MDMLVNYSWPGNIRELKNVIYRSVMLSGNNKISPTMLPEEITSSFKKNQLSADSGEKKNIDLKDASAKAEYDAIMRVLKQVNFNKTKAAQLLNVDRKTLYNKIKSYEKSNSGQD